jgi:hypothetical protein
MPSRGELGIRANISRELLENGRDPADHEVIAEYYSRLFDVMSRDIEENSVSNGVLQIDRIPFKDYSERFDKMIDGDSVGIVIPNEKNRELLERLSAGDRSVFRKLQRYTASVHYNEFADMLERGVISDTGTGIYRLTDPEFYSSDRGLDPKHETVKIF